MFNWKWFVFEFDCVDNNFDKYFVIKSIELEYLTVISEVWLYN